jgi:hypothetical protein
MVTIKAIPALDRPVRPKTPIIEILTTAKQCRQTDRNARPISSAAAPK